MKKVLKVAKKILVFTLVVLYLIFAPYMVLTPLLLEQDNINKTQKPTYYGVIEMWHIESFEGGSHSRSSFLNEIAMQFEKNNKGVYIVVKNISTESALLNLKNNKMPNLISFSIGLGENIAKILQEFNGKKVGIENLILGGKYENKQLAVPYMLGGYVGAQLKSKTISFGANSNNLTSFAAALFKEKGFSFQSSENLIGCDTYEAYVNFINGKSEGLIGTQRDYARINNRINNGSFTGAEFSYLNGFSDLVQYIGLTQKNNDIETEICEKFISFLLAEQNQQKLSDIGMFSVLDGVYSLNDIKTFETHLKQNLKTINVFLDIKSINQIKEQSIAYILGKTNNIDSIKKYLVS